MPEQTHEDQEQTVDTDQLGRLIDVNQWRLRIPQRGIRTDVPSASEPEPAA